MRFNILNFFMLWTVFMLKHFYFMNMAKVNIQIKCNYIQNNYNRFFNAHHCETNI